MLKCSSRIATTTWQSEVPRASFVAPGQPGAGMFFWPFLSISWWWNGYVLCIVMYIQKISTRSRNSTCLFLDEENKFPRSCMKLPHYFLVNSPWFPVRHSIQSIASARQRPASRVWRGHFQMAVPVKCCDFLPIAGGKDPWTSRGRKLENSVTFKNRSPVGWTLSSCVEKALPGMPGNGWNAWNRWLKMKGAMYI